MRQTAKRVADLEQRAGRSSARHHVIHLDPAVGCSRDEAIDRYGREKIGSNDRVIFLPFARSALDG